jgi:hypothetical protein
MRRAVGVVLVLALAACGGSTATHDVREFASVIAQAKLDTATIEAQINAQPVGSDPAAEAQTNLAPLVARLVKLETALRAVGKPDHTASVIVPDTLARLKKITDIGTAWTACSPPGSSQCNALDTAFVPAYADLPRIWADWQPYLG